MRPARAERHDGRRRRFLAELVACPRRRERLHDLRHGAASLLVAADAHPQVATEMLRHAPGSRVTMGVYAHVTAEQQREGADLLDQAVNGLSSSARHSVT
jgi:integrase